MSNLFHVIPLDEREAPQAFPLIRLWDASRTMPEWRALCRSSKSSKGDRGLMAIRDRRGLMHGLFAFRRERTMRHGLVLRVVDVILAQMPGPSLGDVLVEAAEDLCRRLGCDNLVIDVPIRHAGGPPAVPGMLPQRFTMDAIAFRSRRA